MIVEPAASASRSAGRAVRAGHAPTAPATRIALGLRANGPQFALLVLVNAFVGAMVGVERSALPLLASRDFALAGATAATSFIVSFGIAKALANLAAGALVDSRGRKWTLLAGWLAALPVPFLVYFAQSWSWIVVANAFLGINQGLAWSTTVIMKIDLVGPSRRGLAMGLNEFSGYLAVAGAALAAGVLATTFGARESAALLLFGIGVAGVLISAAFVRDTAPHVRLEQSLAASDTRPSHSILTLLARSLWRDRNLFSVSQAGLVNNLNDGVAWGLFPLFFHRAGLGLEEIGVLAAVYPATWGLVQLGTGALSDRVGRKWMIVGGMVLQGMALIRIAVADTLNEWVVALVALGIGTAMVYPTLLATVGDIAPVGSRGALVGVYRLWRDLGYAVGALIAGVVADAFGIPAAIVVVGLLTAASGGIVAMRLDTSSVRTS